MEIYESCGGYIYFKDKELSDYERYNEDFYDYDWHIGHVDDWDDCYKLIDNAGYDPLEYYDDYFCCLAGATILKG